MWDILRQVIRGGALLALVAGAFPPPPARADILHLRDGSRHYGELISEDRREVVFRVVAAGGASSVRRFSAERVARIERTEEAAPPVEPVDGETRGTLSDTDLDQILREAYELLDDRDRPAALRALQRLVQLAPRETLAALDERCRGQRGTSIGELLAEARLDAALDEARRGRPFRLRGVTKIEGEALGVLLERQAEAVLETVYTTRTIREWATGVVAYDEVRSDSRRLVADTRLAASLLAARIRHDARLAGEPAERKRLNELRAELTRFAATVMSLRGYTATPVEAEETQEWFRRHVGRGGTLLRSIPGAAASQPATSLPATSEPESEGRRAPKSHFPEEDEP